MICYEVLHNGNRLCLAGVVTGVLVGALTWGSRREGADQPWSLNLRVGGLTNDSHVDWVARALQVGDEVTFRIVEAEHADSPTEVRPGHARSDLEMSRKYYRELKRRIDELEETWGSQLHG